MPTTNVFRWIDGRGWLVFAGGSDDAVRGAAITRASADGGVAYVKLRGDLASVERAIDDMQDLGAGAGYIVDVIEEDDATITARLGDAGMVVIEAGDSVDDVRAALIGAAVEGIQTAYENGALILIEGVSAMAFGAWVVRDDGSLGGGFEWLDGALIAPNVTSVADDDAARGVLTAQPSAYAVGVDAESALVLGPDGEVETWGAGRITVALGSAYTGGAA